MSQIEEQLEGDESQASPVVDSAAEVDPASRQYAAFRRGAIATLVLSCALALSLNIVDPDLWGHVRYGQELIADGFLPEVATHTYSAPDHPWINHENLAELAMAVGYERIGPVGLLVAKCLLGMGIIGMMVVVARLHAVGILVAWTLGLLVATNLTAFFPLRPQLLSFLWCAVMLVLLDRAFAQWHRREIQFVWLWAVPPLFVVWANSHGGFVAGLCVFGAYLVGRSVELLVRGWQEERRKRKAESGEQGGQAADKEKHKRLIWSMAAITGAACLAAVVNPYGVRLPLWLISSLGRPRPEITEWAAPTPSDPVFFPFVLLAIVAVLAMFGGRKRRDWTQIAILALVGVQAAVHLRHIAFFALLCGFWLPPHFALFIKKLRSKQSADAPDITLAPWLRRTATAVLAGVVLLQGYALTKRLTQLPVYRDHYPVDAFAFMADREIHGRLVVSFNWAQYAIAAFAPDVQVQFDGRFRTCYPQTVVDSHFDFLLGPHNGRRYRNEHSGAIDGTRVLSQGSPDLILIDRGYPYAVAVMKNETNRTDSPWVLLYQDGVAQLWGLRRRFDHPSSHDYLPPEARIVGNVEHKDFIPWPALPPKAIGRVALEIRLEEKT